MSGILNASQVPRLAALGDQWSTPASRDDYPQGLRAFVDGLPVQATAATPSSRGR
ncbi:hypothetical protein [Streptomyces sp. ME18-1-4]|uniref:hypothetical protein n=1 Tax=Streptomyces sp. ME18-1-4 TaxID=3028685 RepID=UPI0029B58B31|nr:hypothetical protein [Streptomyces sp. ME18-1-4]MDX3247609.1 hypothetical protein [Streptomyces sp. ME18-1-4]